MEVEELEDWEEWNPNKLSFVKHMIAGSLAGLAEHVSVFPIDTLKTHVQCEVCGSNVPNKAYTQALKLIREQGVFRLWRGVSAMFAGCIPAHAAYFTVYENSKRILITNNKSLDVEHQPIRAGLCGAMAAVSHDFFMTPFDVVKQRMQLGYYSGLVHCMSTIVKNEGISALYRSMPLTVSINIPHGCVLVAVNESMRIILNPILAGKEKSHTATLSIAMLSGAVGGGIAAAATTPLDLIKTRIQTQRLQPCPRTVGAGVPVAGKGTCTVIPTLGLPVTSSFGDLGAKSVDSFNIRNFIASGSPEVQTQGYRGFMETVRSIIREEGYSALFRGMGPRIATNAPAAGISWAVYEIAKDILNSTSN